jgi:hypothetical protein
MKDITREVAQGVKDIKQERRLDPTLFQEQVQTLMLPVTVITLFCARSLSLSVPLLMLLVPTVLLMQLPSILLLLLLLLPGTTECI